MLSWLEAMTHPDKDIGFFNDSTFGIAPTKEELFAYADRLGLQSNPLKNGLNFFKNSQFVSLKKNQIKLLADMGTVSPSYIPGHAHAETFSFELSIDGQRLFVNSGISTYNNNLIRASERQTQAHNTVTINGKNSSNVWGAFRVGERAYVSKFFAEEDNHTIRFGAKHNGYLKDLNAIHSREFIVAQNEVTIKDHIQSNRLHHIESTFHIHPDFHVTQHNEYTYKISNAGLNAYLKFNRLPSISRPFLWSPEFNTYVHATKIIAQTDSKTPLIAIISWDTK